MAVFTKNSKTFAGSDGKHPQTKQRKPHSYKLHLALSVFYVVDILEF
jgi:hypothetical protein